jgi:hypothetical protein
MPYDYATKIALAAERMQFSPVPLETIRRRALEPAEAVRSQAKWPAVALLAALPIAAAAAGLWHGAHISFINSGINTGAMQFQFDRGEMKANPTHAQIETVAHNLDFPVVLPAGLPQGTFPRMVMRAGRSALVLQYDLPGQWRRDDHLLLIVLADPNALSSSRVDERTKFQLIMGNRRGGTHFMAGSEEVFIMRSSLRPEELKHLQSATIAAAAARTH